MSLSEREKCTHLLRRFGLGSSEAELDYYVQGGLKGAVDILLSAKPEAEVVDFPIEMMENGKGVVKAQDTSVWFSARLLFTRQPLLEKMTLFWHNHFATSADKVTSAYVMGQQIDIIRANALGNFRDLITNVSKDPAMLIWLDGQDNIKGRANENFAREVMELFTLGVGNYSEKDIQEAARAFTGWSFSRAGKKGGKNKKAEYEFKPKLHDEGYKEVLGLKGSLTGEDVLNHLCKMPRTAEFITEKLWNWFVYPNPSAATLKPFVKTFHDSQLDIKTLLRTIMLSDEFYSSRAVRTLVKNPVDFCVSTMRSLGLGEILADQIKKNAEQDEAQKQRRYAAAAGVAVTMKTQGMWLMFPPDVSGWKPGESWITSATMIGRIQWASKLMGTAKGVNVKYPIYNLLSGDPSPFGVAKKITSVFDAPLTGAKLVQLSNAAEKAMGPGGLTPQNANAVAASVMRLVFGAPEFQFC